jgi:hypothetical protein
MCSSVVKIPSEYIRFFHCCRHSSSSSSPSSLTGWRVFHLGVVRLCVSNYRQPFHQIPNRAFQDVKLLFYFASMYFFHIAFTGDRR